MYGDEMPAICSGIARASREVVLAKLRMEGFLGAEAEHLTVLDLIPFLLIEESNLPDRACFKTFLSPRSSKALLAILANFPQWKNFGQRSSYLRPRVVQSGAFVAEKTIESFCWDFDTFLRFAGGKQQDINFTEKDQAMTVAIARVFTSTRHFLFQWYISKKDPSKVPAFNNDKNVRASFYHCMSKCDDEAEFDLHWSEMISRANLKNNK
ncbi:hypothetical protein KSP39_PZI023870 [Platanthera zijinensis]|uniref:Uncharacterized protein n=1 Tax=Platanthera zijinensis TaxID=2320716 RepID=A0AAP0ATQ9_9ASPA